MMATYHLTIDYREHEFAPDNWNGRAIVDKPGIGKISVGIEQPARATRFEWKITGNNGYYDQVETEYAYNSFEGLNPGLYIISVKGCNKYGCTADYEVTASVDNIIPPPLSATLSLNRYSQYQLL